MATRLVQDKEDYLSGKAARAIGRRIDATHHELFVVCGPADALVLQFDLLTPDFIALHGLGGASSKDLLQTVATASGRRVQQLALRRQGFGDTLAVLCFVEWKTGSQGQPVRLYSTDCDGADAAEARRVALVLMGRSKLAVLCGAAGSDAAGELRSLAPHMGDGAWRNRHVLHIALGDRAQVPGDRPPVGGFDWQQSAASTPLVAWAQMATSWNAAHSAQPLPAPALPAAATPQVASEAPQTRPMTLPMPLPAVPADAVSIPVPAAGATAATPSPEPAATSPAVDWQALVRSVAGLPGLLGCCVFDVSTQRTLAFAGTRPGPAVLASQGAVLHATALKSAERFGLSAGKPDIFISFASHHEVLMPLPQQEGTVLHAVFDAAQAPAMLLRMRLQRIVAPGG